MRRCSALLLASLLVTACPRERPVVAERACASACAGLVGADCAPAARTNCLENCKSERALAGRARCGAEYEAFLSCLSHHETSGCTGAASAALRSGVDAPGCQAPFATYARCAEACREHGVVRTGARTLDIGGQHATVQAELTTIGCARELPEGQRGSSPGSRCEYQSVCDPVTCTCPSPTEAYRARVCVDGACATPESACRLGPLAVGHRVCRP